MWTYRQRTGELLDSTGKHVHFGWSGCGENKNCPEKQNVPHEGPIPRGLYRISPAYNHKHLGPVVMNLDPDPTNQMFGRSLFRMHGAAADDPGTPVNETEYSSHGCVIMPREVRILVSKSFDNRLFVTE